MDSLIRQAITQKRIISFDYHGLKRVAEPHVYGRHDGEDQLLVFQIDGQSNSGPVPGWRRVVVGEISNLQVLSEQFAGRRDTPSGKHSKWDHQYVIVD